MRAGRTRWARSTASTASGWTAAAARGTVLDGNTPGDPAVGRVRYRLDCRCGLVVVVRDERLNPVLDRLESAGLTVVTLAALAAILTSTLS